MGRPERHAGHHRGQLRDPRRHGSHLSRRVSPGAVPSPNIWNAPDVYEIENRGVDPDGVIEGFMRSLRPWAGTNVLDIGCGTGFHLPRFAAEAAQVVGVEPHAALAERAALRVRGLANVEVRAGSAQALPVAAASVDIAHARWAYFFGPGCEPGLTELARVMRSGGVAFVIDNDATTSTFGRWFARTHPTYNQDRVDGFFARRGWSAKRALMRWEFETRADFEAVVGIEFAPDDAAAILAEHEGASVDYALVIRHRTF